jgi:hypothetical protein
VDRKDESAAGVPTVVNGGLEDEFAARLVCGGLGTEENEKVAVDFSARGKEEFVSTSITGEGTEAGDFSARGKEEFVSTSITGDEKVAGDFSARGKEEFVSTSITG